MNYLKYVYENHRQILRKLILYNIGRDFIYTVLKFTSKSEKYISVLPNYIVI